MEKIISLADSIKQSVNQVLKNDLLGFWVKGKLYILLVGIIFFIPIMIPVFSMIGKVGNMQESYSTTSAVLATPNFGPGVFEIIMFIAGGIALAVYGVICLNFCTLLAIKVANGTTEPLKPILTLSFKRVWPMFAHMVIKGFILLIGFLLFIIPGIILSIKYMFSEISLLNENLGPIAALRRSSDLTKGYKLNLYLKTIGFTGIQFLLLIPILAFAMVLGNNPMGPIFLEIYAFVSHMVFVYFYLDLLRIKGTVATQQASEPQLTM